jgi:malyl-CoA/(S)-citramalyl-CoA lyase
MRSLLAVPATNPRFLEKGAQSAADAVFIDLEDAVVPELKHEGRGKAVEAIGALDWGARRLFVRVNDMTTPWAEADLAELSRRAGRLDGVILPKCETRDDVRAADEILRTGEVASNRRAPLQLFALVETAKGVANCEAIAAACPRMAGMIFGAGDYQLDLGVLEPTGPFDFALARIANAARAYGLLPIDAPYFDIGNADGMRAACRHAQSLGFEGKMAIHPSQVEIANEVFAPTAAQTAWAREVLEAMDAAAAEGKGAARMKDGKMIDLVHIKIARKILERADRNSNRRNT